MAVHAADLHGEAAVESDDDHSIVEIGDDSESTYLDSPSNPAKLRPTQMSAPPSSGPAAGLIWQRERKPTSELCMNPDVVPPSKRRKTNITQLYIAHVDGDRSQRVVIDLDETTSEGHIHYPEPGYISGATPPAEIDPECALLVGEQNNTTHNRESTERESSLLPIPTPSAPIGGCSVFLPKAFETVLQKIRLAFHAKNSTSRPSYHRWICAPGDPNPITPPVRENKLMPIVPAEDVFLGYNGPHVAPTWRLRDVYGKIKKIVIVDDIPTLVATAYCDPGYSGFSGMLSKLKADYSGIRRLDISWCMAGLSSKKQIESIPQHDAGGSRTSLSSTCGNQAEATAEELEDFDGLPSDSEISEWSCVAKGLGVFCSGPLDSSSDQNALQQIHIQTSLQSKSDAPSNFCVSPSPSRGNELPQGSQDLNTTSRKTQVTNSVSGDTFPSVGTPQPCLMNSSIQTVSGTSDDHNRNALQSCPNSGNGHSKDRPVTCDDVVGSRSIYAPSDHTITTQNKSAQSSESRKQSLGPMLHNTLSQKSSTQNVSSSDACHANESLQPNKGLSSATIDSYLRLFHQPPYHIVDPHYFDVKDPCKMQHKPLPRLPSLSQNGCKILAPVLHSDKHWTLLVLDLWSNTYDHFDSLGQAEYLDDVKELVKEFLAGVKNRIPEACEHNFPSDMQDRPKMWDGAVRPLTCPKQENASDCGVLAVVTAIHLFQQRPVPESSDPNVWRRCFASALPVTTPHDSIATVYFNEENTNQCGSPSNPAATPPSDASSVTPNNKNNNEKLRPMYPVLTAYAGAHKAIAGLVKSFQQRLEPLQNSLQHARAAQGAMQAAYQHASGEQQRLELEAASLQAEIDAYSADAEQISKIKIAKRRDAWLSELQASKDERMKVLEEFQRDLEGVRGRASKLRAAVEYAVRVIGEREDAMRGATVEFRAFNKEFISLLGELSGVTKEMKKSFTELTEVCNVLGPAK